MNTPEPGMVDARKTHRKGQEFCLKSPLVLSLSHPGVWPCPTCHQLHLLSRVSLGVERRMAAVPDLTNQTGGERHVVPANQHAGSTLIGQWEGEHLHLLLDWDTKTGEFGIIRTYNGKDIKPRKREEAAVPLISTRC